MKTSITYSEIACFNRCRQAWDFQYRQLLKRKIDQPPLFSGKLVHKAIELYLKSGLTSTHEDIKNQIAEAYNKRILTLTEKFPHLTEETTLLELNRELTLAMVVAALDYIKQQEFIFKHIKETETKFKVPIYTPKGNPSSKFEFSGKVDGVFPNAILEVKTSKYWSEKDLDLLSIDDQILGYLSGINDAYKLTDKLSTCIFLVIKKSAIKGKQNESREDVLRRMIQDYKDKVMVLHHTQFYSIDDIKNFSDTLWEKSKEMSDPRIYKNVNKFSCGIGCPFRALCTATKDFETIKNLYYETKQVKHEELLEEKENEE